MKKILTAVLAASMAFSMVACSSGESATSSATEGDVTWIITTDTAFMPFEYTDANGNFVGIDVDLLAAIAADQGFEYELQSLGWDGAVAAVQAGQADAIIAGASITDERVSSGWIFSEGYYNATQTIAVATGTEVSDWESLRGENVAVKNGTIGASYADSLKDEYGFTVVKFDDSPTMYQDVLTGNSLACFDDAPVMAANIKQNGLALEIPEGFDNEGSPYGFAIMDEADMELLEMFDAGLANIIASGEYDEILATYLG